MDQKNRKRKRGNYGDLDAALMGTDNFDWFRKYLDVITNLLSSEEIDLRTAWSKLKDNDSGLVSDASEMLFRRSYQFSEHERILLGSFCAGIWSSIEQLFISLCFGAQIEQEVIFKYTDIKGGRGMGQAKNYLKKVLGVDLPRNLETRQSLEVARIIRNAVVHAEGLISDSSEWEKIQQYGNTHKNELELDSDVKRVSLKIPYTETLLVLHGKMREEFQDYLDEIEKDS